MTLAPALIQQVNLWLGLPTNDSTHAKALALFNGPIEPPEQPIIVVPFCGEFTCIEYVHERSCWYNPNNKYYTMKTELDAAYAGIALRLNLIQPFPAALGLHILED